MRKAFLALALSSLAPMVALAGSWSGKLLDASCYSQQKQAASCDATSKTTAFGLEVSGTFYKLDSTGNTKAIAALKNRADRSDPTKQQSTVVTAKVDGTENSGTIMVESIDVQ
jgi:hypothetical protein